MHRRSKRVLTALGVAVVVLAVTYAALLVRAQAQLRQAYAALAAEGRPMQAVEVLPPRVADTNNAAVLYQSAVLLLKGQSAGDRSLYEQLTGRPWERLSKDERKHWIGQEIVAQALAVVEEGTRRPACRIEHSNDNLFEVPLGPPMDDMRNLAAILRERERFEAQTGHTARAWDLLVTQLRFADSLRSDPASTTQFTRLVISLWASRAIRGLCETAPPDREHMRVIENLLQRQEDIEPLIRAVDSERLLIGEWFFSLPRAELDKILWREQEQDRNRIAPPGVLKVNHRLSFLQLAFKPRLIADHAAYLQMMRKRVQLLQGPYRNARESDAFLNVPGRNYLARKLIGYAGGDKWFYCRAVTDMHLTRAGLALLQYKQEHDTFPETLAAVGLADLTDPYADKPLRYRPEGDGFVVYSIGEDRKDNGGMAEPPWDSSNPRRRNVEYDEVWRFPNPANHA